MPRTRYNAPKPVRDRGGVALSLWMTGANETDTVLVARLSEQCEKYERILTEIDTCVSDDETWPDSDTALDHIGAVARAALRP